MKIENKCFAHQIKNDKSFCRALNKLYCKNENCNFYRNDITREEIERSIRQYSKK